MNCRICYVLTVLSYVIPALMAAAAIGSLGISDRIVFQAPGPDTAIDADDLGLIPCPCGESGILANPCWSYWAEEPYCLGWRYHTHNMCWETDTREEFGR